MTPLVISFGLEGWPESASNDAGLCRYWVAGSYLSVVEGGLLLHNDGIVIPGSLHKEMLQRIHSEEHLCLNKCRKRAQDSVWWPHLGPDLKWWIDNCSFCLQNIHWCSYAMCMLFVVYSVVYTTEAL